jgi:hypothetical protein
MGKGKKELPVDQKLISFYGIEDADRDCGGDWADRHRGCQAHRTTAGRARLPERGCSVQVVIQRLDAMSAEIERRLPNMSDRNIATR